MGSRFLEDLGSLKAGKAEADARVELSLYQRAVGYSYDAVKMADGNRATPVGAREQCGFECYGAMRLDICAEIDFACVQFMLSQILVKKLHRNILNALIAVILRHLATISCKPAPPLPRLERAARVWLATLLAPRQAGARPLSTTDA
jgi:hypothetical protein